MHQAADMLSQVETRIGGYGRRVGRERLELWATVCPTLRASEVRAPADIPAWLWALSVEEQDRALRALVHFAQAQDELALLVVVACLRPGLLRLAGRTSIPVDDVVVEAAARVLEYPIERRRRVAAGLVMDVRYRFWSARQRELPAVLMEPDELRALEPDAASPGPGERSAAEELAAAVADACDAGWIAADDARLIIETRVLGDTVEVAAKRRDLPLDAAYWHRRRAEARLIEVGAA